MSISLIVLFAVFILIAARQTIARKLAIWQIMLFGAIIVLLTGEITLNQALKAVNCDVMLFLFGIFIVGRALEESGYLERLVYKMFKGAKTPQALLLHILFIMALFSALFMNDTIAIIATPLVLYFSRQHHLPAKLLLLALAFGVTIGSAMSPIGNPQNLLIALNSPVNNPFVDFFRWLAGPTLINLLAAYVMLRWFYKDCFHNQPLAHFRPPLKDAHLARLAKASLIMVTTMIAAKIIFVFFKIPLELRLTYIALIACLPVVMFSPRRLAIIRAIDWPTLIFFAAMFILMESVWQKGFFQATLNGINLVSLPAIFIVSIIFSQFISNVPYVALYLPMLVRQGAGVKEMAALAAASTIAGNLFILGAASNIIIIQNAEKHGETLTFWEFSRVGIPLTLINTAVYMMFMK